MKKTIEVLKNAGIIEKIQKNFSDNRPPKGTSDETIVSTIETILHMEVCVNSDFRKAFFDALVKDAADSVKNELNIEFCEEDEFENEVRKTVNGMIDFLFGKRV